MAVTDFRISIVIDGTTFNTTKPLSSTTPAIVGPVRVAVDNGKDIGAIRTKSCTFSLRDFRSTSKSYTRYDKPVEVWVAINQSSWILVYSGTIVESDVTFINDSRFGQGIEANITCLDDARKVQSLGSFASTKEDFDIIRYLEPHLREIAGIRWKQDPSFYAEKEMVEGVENPDADTPVQFSPPAQFNTTYKGKKYGSNRELPLTQHISDDATRMLARAYIESGLWGRIFARLGHGVVYEVPADCVTGLGAIKSNTDEKRHRVSIKYQIGTTSFSDVRDGYRKSWFYPSTTQMGYEETTYDVTEFTLLRYQWERETDWTQKMAESSVNWQARAMLGRPARDFILSDATILLSVMAERYSSGLPFFLLRSIFDTRYIASNYRTVFIPTITVPGIAGQSGLPTKLEGIVETAELILNPLSHARTDRALLTVKLGPGDVARDHASPTYKYPTWDYMSERWADAPTRMTFDSWTAQTP